MNSHRDPPDGQYIRLCSGPQVSKPGYKPLGVNISKNLTITIPGAGVFGVVIKANGSQALQPTQTMYHIVVKPTRAESDLKKIRKPADSGLNVVDTPDYIAISGTSRGILEKWTGMPEEIRVAFSNLVAEIEGTLPEIKSPASEVPRPSESLDAGNGQHRQTEAHMPACEQTKKLWGMALDRPTPIHTPPRVEKPRQSAIPRTVTAPPTGCIPITQVAGFTGATDNRIPSTAQEVGSPLRAVPDTTTVPFPGIDDPEQAQRVFADMRALVYGEEERPGLGTRLREAGSGLWKRLGVFGGGTDIKAGEEGHRPSSGALRPDEVVVDDTRENTCSRLGQGRTVRMENVGPYRVIVAAERREDHTDVIYQIQIYANGRGLEINQEDMGTVAQLFEIYKLTRRAHIQQGPTAFTVTAINTELWAAAKDPINSWNPPSGLRKLIAEVARDIGDGRDCPFTMKLSTAHGRIQEVQATITIFEQQAHVRVFGVRAHNDDEGTIRCEVEMPWLDFGSKGLIQTTERIGQLRAILSIPDTADPATRVRVDWPTMQRKSLIIMGRLSEMAEWRGSGRTGLSRAIYETAIKINPELAANVYDNVAH